jgi:hypothetical protein
MLPIAVEQLGPLSSGPAQEALGREIKGVELDESSRARTDYTRDITGDECDMPEVASVDTTDVAIYLPVTTAFSQLLNILIMPL